jgi:hypothetical protein
MKLIAHRGNLNGPNSLEENNPQYIENAISKGFDVEIDIWYDILDKTFYLGHDNSQYIIEWFWLLKYKNYLWIHCKNIESLFKFTYKTSGFNYFWHQNDDYTLTSKNNIWSYPGKIYNNNAVIVMPEWNNPNWDILKVANCYGICTDYPEKLK